MAGDTEADARMISPYHLMESNSVDSSRNCRQDQISQDNDHSSWPLTDEQMDTHAHHVVENELWRPAVLKKRSLCILLACLV